MLSTVITNKNTKVSGLVLLKNFKKRARKGSKLEPYCMWTRPLCIHKVVGKGTYISSTVARILQIFLALCSPYNMTCLKLHYDPEEEPKSSPQLQGFLWIIQSLNMTHLNLYYEPDLDNGVIVILYTIIIMT